MITQTSYQNLWEKQQWFALADLVDLPIQQPFDKSLLSLMVCGAALQLDDSILAKKMMQKAFNEIENKSSLMHFALAAQQVQLGKVAFLAGQHEQALVKFQNAFKGFGLLTLPLFYGFLCEAAESQLFEADTQGAIQTLQDIACILQEHTPEQVYHRMSYAYSVNKGFGGTPEVNHCFGDCHKHDLLSFFHQQLQPEFYFEIGVDEGLSLARAKGKALGVDARPELNLAVSLSEQAEILGISSDGFFQQQADNYFSQAPDLAFIDGMHLFEFALRDFINLERYSAPWTLVGIDDVFPCHPVQAERRRISSAWTGDVWKLYPILKKYRPDLTLLLLPCATTGLLLITGLDKNNTQLIENYDQILQDYQQNLPVPESILQRKDSIPSDHPVVSLLLSFLREAKEQYFDLDQLREKLATLRFLKEQAKDNDVRLNYPKSLVILEQEKQLTAQLNSIAQLFIPQSQEPVYHEGASIKQTLKLRGWQELYFDFETQSDNASLRFDPATQASLLEVSEIQLVDTSSQGTLLHLQGETLRCEVTLGGDCFLLKNNQRFCIYSFANDPILFLPPVNAANRPLRLKICLRQIEEGADQRALWTAHLRA